MVDLKITPISNFIKKAINFSIRSIRNIKRDFRKTVAKIKKIIKKLIFQIFDKKIDEEKLMINIGGGNFFRRHWRVLEYPSKHYQWNKIFIDYYHDLTSNKPFPFFNDQVAFFYCSHTLEHIPQEYCQYIFDEIFRCLKPGGAVRLTMPDYDLAYKAFQENNIEFFHKYGGETIESKFLNVLATYFKDKVLTQELRKNFSSMTKEKFADFYTKQVPRDYQLSHGGNHINWWNYEKAKKMLEKAKFKNIYRSTSQGSHFVEMRGGDDRNSGFDSSYPKLSMFIEAVK